MLTVPLFVPLLLIAFLGVFTVLEMRSPHWDLFSKKLKGFKVECEAAWPQRVALQVEANRNAEREAEARQQPQSPLSHTEVVNGVRCTFEGC